MVIAPVSHANVTRSPQVPNARVQRVSGWVRGWWWWSLSPQIQLVLGLSSKCLLLTLILCNKAHGASTLIPELWEQLSSPGKVQGTIHVTARRPAVQQACFQGHCNLNLRSSWVLKRISHWQFKGRSSVKFKARLFFLNVFCHWVVPHPSDLMTFVNKVKCFVSLREIWLQTFRMFPVESWVDRKRYSYICTHSLATCPIHTPLYPTDIGNSMDVSHVGTRSPQLSCLDCW